MVNITITGTNDPTTGVVTINNTSPDLLRTLTSSNSLSDVDNTVNIYAYQWESLTGTTWTAITGATQINYTTTEADAGHQLRVVYTYALDNSTTPQTWASAPTDPVGPYHIIQGTSNPDRLSGTVAPDHITGLAGDDILIGNAGADLLEGGDGNDTYVVGTGDVVVEAVSGGFDAVYTDVNYTLSADIEQVVLTGNVAISATGNDQDNFLYGVTNSAANTLTGGLGNDTYVVGTGDVVVESADAGFDTVYTDVDYSLSANIEQLALTGSAAISVTGNGQDNFLYGVTNSAANTLAGGLGNDTYVVGTGDVVVEAVGAGFDAVYSDIDYILSDNVEYLIGIGTKGMSLTGNGGDNVIWGTSFADNLNGGAGNDWLIGGAGADTLTGGLGADTFMLTSLGDSGLGAANRDIIADFISGTDKIDFSAIDANTSASATGNQAFQLIGSAGFSNVAGQLRFFVDAGDTMFEGDTNGDGVADFQLQLTGIHTFAPADFLL